MLLLALQLTQLYGISVRSVKCAVRVSSSPGDCRACLFSSLALCSHSYWHAFSAAGPAAPSHSDMLIFLCKSAAKQGLCCQQLVPGVLWQIVDHAGSAIEASRYPICTILASAKSSIPSTVEPRKPHSKVQYTASHCKTIFPGLQIPLPLSELPGFPRKRRQRLYNSPAFGQGCQPS